MSFHTPAQEPSTVPFSGFPPGAHWIHSAQATRPVNNFVLFRRAFAVQGRARQAVLHLTADSRYELFVNGTCVGAGPPRSWKEPWPVDTYDITGLLRPGQNVLAVRTQHYGIGTFQYIHAQPGLLATLLYQDDAGKHAVRTDTSWRALANAGHSFPTPRIDCQQAWEEQFDARREPADWRELPFNDSAWPCAINLRPAGAGDHATFEQRDIPMLTREIWEPKRVLAWEIVRPADVTWSVNARPMFNAADRTANTHQGKIILATHMFSPVAQAVQLHQTRASARWLLNGKDLAFSDVALQLTETGVAHAHLKKGWNLLMAAVDGMHLQQPQISLWSNRTLRFAARPAPAGRTGAWLVIGPFAQPRTRGDWCGEHAPHVVAQAHPEATEAKFHEIVALSELPTELLNSPLARVATPDMVSTDIMGICTSERVVSGASPRVTNGDALLTASADWTVISPSRAGDTRFLLEYADELVGYQEFEIDAPAGTIVDNQNFEFIQRDGRKNLAEDMNNSFRYICRAGVQQFRTFVRQGLRYSWYSLRNFNRPVRVRYVRTICNNYPQARHGAFACSDMLLEKIWTAGVQSVRCCSEDTYTDCPTYEQTFWVGDGRNEALVDLIANGDPRLSRHSCMQAARSLKRSPIVESQVPSAWENILPAWSFLWMRWAQEHFQFTGDRAFARDALRALQRNVAGIAAHLNADGLFAMQGWNMFDWAAMDTPADGVVTHVNCLAVLGLRQAALLARQTGQNRLSTAWDQLANNISEAINQCLWDKHRQAFIDSIHYDGVRSPVYSQQTQTAAYISGVAHGARRRRCFNAMQHPPAGFIEAGSPFFMFFMLEGLAAENRLGALLDTIRSYWGVQIEAGATTFWEMYHPAAPRHTRSHCHGWSAAPAYFLTAYVLGVRPMKPGYDEVLISPMLAALPWAQGRVPTPHGVVEVSWRRRDNVIELSATIPDKLPGTFAPNGGGRFVPEKGHYKKSGKHWRGVGSFSGTLHVSRPNATE